MPKRIHRNHLQPLDALDGCSGWVALDYQPSAIHTPSPKRLILQDPQVVRKYNSILRKLLIKKEVLPKLQQLESDISGKILPSQIRT
jgi:hypothetical protein